jgi:hypothetical protein
MVVTIANCITLAQQKLGDEGGELFTSAILLPHILSAFRDLGRLMKNIEIPQSKRVRYAQILANQSSFTFDRSSSIPSGAPAALPNYSSTVEIAERAESESFTISAISGSGSDLVQLTTSIVHDLVVGQVVMVVGTGYRWLDGAHSVFSKPTSSSITVRGTFTPTSVAAAAGVISVGNGIFQPVSIDSVIRDYPLNPVNQIAVVSINENTLNFSPCNNNRQLRVMYSASADQLSATSDLIGWDDAIDFLAVVGAGAAASAKGAQGKAEILEQMAFGPSRNRTNPDGGLARALLADGVKAMQHQQWARPTWRARRYPLGLPYPFF